MRVFRGLLLYAAPVYLFLNLFVLCQTQFTWQVDDKGYMTPYGDYEPSRRYTPDVEQALLLLEKTDPAKATYLRSSGIPIKFTAFLGEDVKGQTDMTHGEILLLSEFQGKPAQLAVLLSHEAFHAARHDRFGKPPAHSIAYRWLWRTEEQQAHVEDLRTAVRLLPGHPDVWRVFGIGWLFEPFLNLWAPGWFCLNLALLLWWSRWVWRTLVRPLRPPTVPTCLPPAFD